jgi:hypothetical protein
MSDLSRMWIRVAAIVTLVESSPSKVLGRTALVKLLYLLEELHGLSLGYDFRLYAYGPFDAGVLYDLGCAQSLKAVTVETVVNPLGYGYEIRSAAEAELVKQNAADWVRQYRHLLEAVAQEFGSWSASDLELATTILYADREFAASSEAIGQADLVRRVHGVKPHFSEAIIQGMVRNLLARGYLRSLANASRAPSREPS